MERHKKIVYPDTVFLRKRKFPDPQGYPIGGGVQLTYFFEGRVLQVSPSFNSDIPSYFLKILNRWIVPKEQPYYFDKFYLLKKIIEFARLSIPSINYSGWKLNFPEIDLADCGYLDCKGVKFPYWVCDKIEGYSLREIEENCIIAENYNFTDFIELYKLLVNFLAIFHTKIIDLDSYFTEIGVEEKSLYFNYLNRLNNIKLCLKDLIELKVLNTDSINKLIELAEYFLNRLNLIISPDEKISLIHGDFRGDNIIVNLKERYCWLLDFEQGIFGGDWIADLWKIYLFSSSIKSGNLIRSKEIQDILIKQYIFQRKLLEGEKSKILLDYCTEIDHELLEERIDLLRYDAFISALILRFLMGWYFYEKEDSNKFTLRGIYYISDLLEKIMKRRLK